MTNPPAKRMDIWPALAGLLIVFAVIIVYARQATVAIVAITINEGMTAAAWLFAATLMGAAVLKLLRADVKGLLHWTTAAGIGTGVLSLAMFGLGMSGLVSRAAVVSLLVVSVVIGLISLKFSGVTCDASQRGASTAAKWVWLIVTPFLGMVIVGACLLPGLLWRPGDPHPYDVLVYHLQIPREWYEIGRMVPLSHNVFSFFPFNAEMHFWAAMYLRGDPWSGAYSAQFMNVGFAVLTVLAIYCGAKEISDDGSMLAAIVVGVSPWVVMLSCVAYVEGLYMLFTALSMAWALRAIRSSSISNFVFAGLMAGFAAGVKLTAVPMLIMPMPVAVFLIMRSKRAFVGCIVLVVCGVIALSPWLIRNYKWSGNPVFPLALKTLGEGEFNSVEVQRFEQAHTAPPGQNSPVERLQRVGSEIFWNWQFGYAIWPLAILAFIQQWRRREVWACAIVLVLMLIIWIGFTHLIGRFFVGAIPIAGLLIAQLRLGKWLPLAAAFVVLASIVPAMQLHQQLDRWAETGRDGTFGMTDLRPMVPQTLQDIEQNGAGPVYMVGDSQAFLHQIPMSRLKYRTVFDLDSTRPFLESWIGEPVNQLPPDASIYIDPLELKRLSGTYYDVPFLPDDLAGPRDHPFVITPKDLTADERR